MKTHNLLSLSGAALVAILVATPAAVAQSFSFDFAATDGSGVNADLQFIDVSGQATSGSLTLSGAAANIAVGSPAVTYGLLTGPSPVNVPGNGGADIIFDTSVDPSNPVAVFDSIGVAFGFNDLHTVAHGENYQAVVNLWSNGGGSYTLWDSDSSGNFFYNGTLSEIPEPSTYAAILGGAALAFVVLRGKRIAS